MILRVPCSKRDRLAAGRHLHVQVDCKSAAENFLNGILTEISSFEVLECPSDLVFTNCLIVHPSDFQAGQHVLVANQFPITVRLVFG